MFTPIKKLVSTKGQANRSSYVLVHLVDVSSCHTRLTAVACEHSDLTINCPSRGKIHLISAVYGRESADVCPDE